LDEKLDWGYHSAIAQAGAVLEYDTFGYEGYQVLARYPNDTERMEWIARLVEEGFDDQLVLGCDAGCKMMLKAYGGGGYEHLLKRIVPALAERHGVERRSIEKMIVTTPRRLLNRP
jgi:phosphotriesterase-related protein